MHSLKRRAGWMAVLATTSLILSALIAGPVSADPPGNNGTVKVHDEFEAEPIVRNEPHVGCDFHFHFFFADAGQTGDWWVESWPPTGDMTTVLDGEYGPTNAAGEWSTGPLSLETGHYKLFWEGSENPGGQQNIKHKVFWVECEENGGVTTESEQLRLLKQSDEGGVLAGVVFTLTAQGSTTGTSLSTDAGGRITWSNLQPGTFVLTETTPAGCTGIGSITLTIAANGTVTVMNPPASVTVSGDMLTIVNDCGGGNGGNGGNVGGGGGGPTRSGTLAGGGGPSTLPDTALPPNPVSVVLSALATLLMIGGLGVAGLTAVTETRRRR